MKLDKNNKLILRYLAKNNKGNTLKEISSGTGLTYRQAQEGLTKITNKLITEGQGYGGGKKVYLQPDYIFHEELEEWIEKNS